MSNAGSRATETSSRSLVSPKDWERAKVVLTLGADLPDVERLRLVEARFPNDPTLQAGVLSLFETYDRTRHSLEPTPQAGPPEGLIHEGEQYKSYRVIRPVGQGGMGQVFLAEDLVLGRRVALKTLAGQWMDSPSARRQLLTEARAVARLEHLNIVRLYEFFEDPRCIILVMEYIEGRSGRELLADGPVPLGLALRLGIQICDAVVYAHDHGILHCDLKPSNVQINPEGIAKVLDFGLAQARYDWYEFDPEATPRGPVVGTPAYMAPERLLGVPPKETSDVYSLGVTLFELVTGRRPFDESHPAALTGAILESPTPKASSMVSDCPARLDEVLQRAMEKDSRQRYQTARELGRDLREVLEILDGDSRAGTESMVRPVSSRLMWATILILGSFAGLTVTGLLTSTFYNSPLGIPMAEGESPLLWPVWGIRSLILPAFQVGIAILICGLALQVWRIAFTLPAVSGWYERIRALGSIERLRLIRRSTLAAGLLMVQAATVWLVVRRFGPIFESFSSFFLQSGSLQILGPDSSDEHQWFRRAFSLLALGFGWSWYRLLKARHHTEPISTTTLATGVFLMILMFFCIVVPYRLFVHNEAEVVYYQSSSCYLVGQKGNEARLFCPHDEPPWNRIVQKEELKHSGRTESIFSVPGNAK